MSWFGGSLGNKIVFADILFPNGQTASLDIKKKEKISDFRKRCFALAKETLKEAYSDASDIIKADGGVLSEQTLHEHYSQNIRLQLKLIKTAPAGPSSPGSPGMADGKMPPEDVVTRQFEEMMEAQLIKSEAKDRMRQLPLSKKWLMVQSHQALAKRNSISSDSIMTLNPQNITLEQLRTLTIHLRSEGKKWLTQFASEGGLIPLLSFIGKGTEDRGDVERIKQLEGAFEALKAFMNNEFGLDLIARTPNAIDQIARTLYSPSDILRIRAMELLSVILWLSDEGYQSVMKALRNRFVLANASKKESKDRFTHPFQILVNPFIRSQNIALKANTMLFINTLINSRDRLEERVTDRRGFIELGLAAFIQAMRHALQEGQEDEDSKSLMAQCELFESEASRDQVEIERNAVDLSDIDACWNYVKTAAMEQGLSNQILELIHTLMYIPPNLAIAENVWSNINHIVKEAVGSAEGELLTYAELKEMLAKKESFQPSQMELIAEKQQRDIMALQNEVKELKTELKKAKEVAASTPIITTTISSNAISVASPLPPEPPPVPPTFDGAPPAPPLDGIPMPPPFFDGVPSAPPLFDGVPMAPSLDGVPMAPFLSPDGVPMAPSLDGIPMPPGFAAAPPEPTLPPKPQPKPRVKLRNFHWEPLPPKKIKNTIWGKLSDDKVRFDVKELENLFAQQAAKPAKTKESAPKGAVAAAAAPQLIDSKRSFNINLMLGGLGMKADQIREALLALDPSILTEGKLQTLCNCLPTQEELDSVTGYDGDKNLLGSTEKFILAIAAIQRPQVRLPLLLFKIRFDDQFAEVDRDLKICEDVTSVLLNSANLYTVLEYCLGIGNYLNAGSNKGGAYGFKLSTLSKLARTKGQDNSTSILHFVVNAININSKDSRRFLDELKHVEAASRLEYQSLASQVSKMQGTLNQLSNELKNIASDNRDGIVAKNDRFFIVMNEFYTTGSAKAENLAKRLARLDEDLKKAIELYGEDASQFKMEQFFQVFLEFTHDYSAVEAKLEKERIEAEKEAKKNAPKRRSIASPTSSGPEKGSGPPPTSPASPSPSPPSPPSSPPESKSEAEVGKVDQVLGTLKTSNAEELAKILRARRERGTVSNKPGVPRVVPSAAR